MKRFCYFLIFILVIGQIPILSLNTTAEGYVRGVWISTVNNLDYPSKSGLDSSVLKNEIDDIIDKCKENNINTVFFQVRPCADALYKSNIFPWSGVLSGKQGIAPEGDFDPLSYFVKKAHSSNIKLHAWINPYRIGTGGVKKVISSLADSNPAVLHPEYRVECSNGGVYFNPALSEVRKLIVDGVMEIVENYNIDGIVFDDYFYPYDVTDFPDSEEYEKYGSEFSDIADFRRDNVNQLIKEVNEAIKSHSTYIRFGISPFGIWDNLKDNPEGSETSGMSSYRSIYADSRAWVENEWIDYICPQIYWSFENQKAPFDKLCNWWNDLCKDSNVDLYIGHTLHKMWTDEEGWGDAEQLLRQIKYTNSMSSVDGNVIFRSELLDTDLTLPKEVKTETVSFDFLKITSPENGFQTTAPRCSVTGVANPSDPLTVNGTSVDVTEHGYFSVYVNLSLGNNNFEFQNGNSTNRITIKRVKTIDNDNVHNVCFEKNSAYPFGKTMLYSGENVTFKVNAIDGCEIKAVFNGNEIILEPGVKQSGYTEYSKTITLPNLFANNSDVGNLSFVANYKGKEYTYDAADIKIIHSPITLYTLNECYVYDNVKGGSMMDNYQLPSGAVITATAKVGDSYRLISGKWINANNVSTEFSSDIESSLSIDTAKYEKTEFTFKTAPTFVSRVTDGGTLAMEFYGANNPVYDSEHNIRFINRGTGCVALFKSNTPVTGFYVSQSDNVITVYTYKHVSSLEGKTIVIDAGHGGEDPGALGPAGTYASSEADLNLSLSYLLKQKLEMQGATVYLTREDNLTLPLNNRAGIIRDEAPDISISIHHNSVDCKSDFNKASGVLVLYSRETAKPLADTIEKYLARNTGISSEGAKTQSLGVCRDYRYPCILLECGYVCNPVEYELLLTNSYKNTICDNITEALLEYFK